MSRMRTQNFCQPNCKSLSSSINTPLSDEWSITNIFFFSFPLLTFEWKKYTLSLIHILTTGLLTTKIRTMSLVQRHLPVLCNLFKILLFTASFGMKEKMSEFVWDFKMVPHKLYSYLYTNKSLDGILDIINS